MRYFFVFFKVFSQDTENIKALIFHHYQPVNFQIIILQDGNPFLSDDLSLLESLEYEQRIKYLVEIIDQVEWVGIDPDDLTR